MNPFQLSPAFRTDTASQGEDQTALRTMRLLEDLSIVAADIDANHWASVAIVQSPGRLQVSTYGTGPHVTPLLAAALLAALEQMIAAGEMVRAKLPPEWRQRLLGTSSR